MGRRQQNALFSCSLVSLHDRKSCRQHKTFFSCCLTSPQLALLPSRMSSRREKVLFSCRFYISTCRLVTWQDGLQTTETLFSCCLISLHVPSFPDRMGRVADDRKSYSPVVLLHHSLHCYLTDGLQSTESLILLLSYISTCVLVPCRMGCRRQKAFSFSVLCR